MGFEATALLAGYEAWKERYPVELAEEQRVAWHSLRIIGFQIFDD
jgi:hypothetical protein